MTIGRSFLAHRDMARSEDALHANQCETAAHQAARLLNAHPERDWRLRDLAELVHLSTSQLGRTFNIHFGIPPMQYLSRVRTHRLARLLRETDLPIGMAMVQVGWHSRGHAARQFTAILGVTPLSYRRKVARQGSAAVRKASHPCDSGEEESGSVRVGL